MLNNSEWWNSGGAWMLLSGGNVDGPGAALHEGGHGFHQLADEYGTCTGASCGSNTNGYGEPRVRTTNEVNSCGNPMTTDGKWDDAGSASTRPARPACRALGRQPLRRHGPVPPDRELDDEQPVLRRQRHDGLRREHRLQRPLAEQMIMDIWRNVVADRFDRCQRPARSTNPATLTVNVIDPAVISVDWSVDGTVVAANGGPTFTLAGRGLTSGSHMISARAYDNASMDLVKYRTGTTFGRMNWARSVQTVNWTVTIP